MPTLVWVLMTVYPSADPGLRRPRWFTETRAIAKLPCTLRGKTGQAPNTSNSVRKGPVGHRIDPPLLKLVTARMLQFVLQ